MSLKILYNYASVKHKKLDAYALGCGARLCQPHIRECSTRGCPKSSTTKIIILFTITVWSAADTDKVSQYVDDDPPPEYQFSVRVFLN